MYHTKCSLVNAEWRGIITKLENILSWEGPTGNIESKSWLRTVQPKN